MAKCPQKHSAQTNYDLPIDRETPIKSLEKIPSSTLKAIASDKPKKKTGI